MRPEPLEPPDRAAFRAFAHRALDEALDGIEQIASEPAWREVPEYVKRAFAADPLPREPHDVAEVYAEFAAHVAPFGGANRHPRFFGWVQGAGTQVSVVAEALAAALNPNLGGREHAPVYLERRVIDWWREIFGFPAQASGILTSGSSMANLIAVLVARRWALGEDVRADGLAALGAPLVGYTSAEAHGSLPRAFDVAGLGAANLRAIEVDDALRLDVAALRRAIAADRALGKRPFFLAATAGSAGTGAIDDLCALAEVARSEGLWFHVDGAFGALARLGSAHQAELAGLERADSLAFDLHKWLHVAYDVGAVLVRDGALHQATFSSHAHYLARAERGAAAGEPWFTDFGPELSRSFRALKVWFTMKTFGLAHFGALIDAQCALAQSCAASIEADPELELLAPVHLNIVCFRYVPRELPMDAQRELEALNGEIIVELQTRGIAVPSTVRVRGVFGMRLCIMNHRTHIDDLEQTLVAVRAVGAELVGRMR